MNARSYLAVLFVVALLGGCAAPPQLPVQLDNAALVSKGGRIGVGATALPKVEMQLPGASCLLCIIAAATANSSLSNYASTLPYEDLPKLKDMIAERLRKKGMDAVVIGEDINVDSLEDLSGNVPNRARKDLSPLRKKYDVDRLLVIEIKSLGFIRTYSAYFPTSDPRSTLEGLGYIVNLSNNMYEWYSRVHVVRGADKSWDEPPKFPGLTNAYFAVLETAKDRFLEPFGN